MDTGAGNVCCGVLMQQHFWNRKFLEQLFAYMTITPCRGFIVWNVNGTGMSVASLKPKQLRKLKMQATLLYVVAANHFKEEKVCLAKCMLSHMSPCEHFSPTQCILIGRLILRVGK
jgi:hypothetical protein